MIKRILKNKIKHNKIKERIPHFPPNCRKVFLISTLRQFFKTTGTVPGQYLTV